MTAYEELQRLAEQNKSLGIVAVMFDLATAAIGEARDRERAVSAEKGRVIEQRNRWLREMAKTFDELEARITELQAANTREVGARHAAEAELSAAQSDIVQMRTVLLRHLDDTDQRKKALAFANAISQHIDDLQAKVSHLADAIRRALGADLSKDEILREALARTTVT